MRLLLLLLILLFSFFLIKSADVVIASVRKISLKTKTGVFAISAIVLAIGTSLPELTVSVTSALSDSAGLVLGVVVGSNIANIALVAGISTLIRGKVLVQSSYFKRDIVIALLASLAPLVLILDREIDRVDGLILLAIYASYTTSFFRKRYLEVAKGARATSFLHSIFRKISFNSFSVNREYGKLLIGVAMLLLSGELIVRTSTALANALNIPIFLVGLFILAVGTSLPELAFSIRSLKQKHPSMFFGNLLGSTIANSTLIVGIASVIHPIKLLALSEYALAAIVFLLVFVLFWIFIRTKHTLARWEALVLLLIYAIFILVEFWS